MKEKLFNVVKFALGWPISLIALFFLGKTFFSQTTNVSDYLRHINLQLLIPASLCFIAYYFLRSVIWYKIIRFAGHELDARESLFTWSFTQLRRYIPGNIWAALGVATQYSKKNITKKDVGTYILWETEFVIISAVIIGILSLPLLLSVYIKVPDLILPLMGISLVLCGAGVYIYCNNRRIISLFSGKVHTILLHLFPSFKPSDTGQGLFNTGLSFLFLGLGYFLCIVSFTYLDPNILWQFIGFFTLSLLIGFVSIITPSGLGVREGVLTIFLGNFMTIPTAAFASIFCRLILIICEVLFVAIAYLIHKTREGRVGRIISTIMNNSIESALLLSTALFSWYFTVISFLRYDNFYTGRFDLGNMSQTVWNTSHGRIFEFTNPNSIESVSRLAFHADFILVLLSPFYLLWDNPKMLLLIQVLVVGAGALVVYAIAQHFLKSKVLSLVIALSYLLNPSLQRAVIYDFHGATLATTFLLAAMYFIFKKRYGWFIIFALLAGLCKEQIWAVTGLMGLYIAIFQRKIKFGLLTFLASAAIAVFLVWYAIPQAAGGSQHFALEYYGGDGSISPTQLIERFITSPGEIFSTLTGHDRVSYLKKLLEPVGYLPLLGPLFLIFAIPDLLINMLSTKPELYQIYYQYTAVITPFLFIALITGITFLKKNFPKIPQYVFITYVAFFMLLGAYRFGPLPGSVEPNLDMIVRPFPNREKLDQLLSDIPESKSVSTTNNIGSHLSLRENLYTVPFGMDVADYVIEDTADGNLPEDMIDYASKSAMLKSSKDYKLYYQDKTISAYKRISQ